MAFTLLKPQEDRRTVVVSLLVLRLIVAAIFLAHGSQKLFGWFGGAGLTAFVEKSGLGPIAYLVAIGEFFGGLGMIPGVLVRFSALANLIIMGGAIVQVTGPNGFFLENKGFEYNLALIGLLLPLLLAGPGPYNIPRLLVKKVPFFLE